MHYEEIHPCASYAPWREDLIFQETYEQIKPYTLVDEYRCYELWSLIEQSAKLSGAILEVGVMKGGSGALIAKKALLSGLKDTVYLCDTFHGVVKTGPKDPYYKEGEHHECSLNDVKQLLHMMQVTNTKVLKGIFPEETSHLVTDEKFRFCHIDVDVYESGRGVLDWVWDRLVVGGMIVFDDYGFSRCGGITLLVNEFKSFRNVQFIHNLNGHAILIKRG